jgi:carbon storage regulator
MLILSRRVGEKIVVPECGLSVAVVGIQGGRVRLGITAPPELAVHREEVASAIEAGRADDNLMSDEDCWDAMAADLSDAACQVVLRHRPANSWTSLQTDVKRALAKAVERWKQQFEPSESDSPPQTRPAKTVRLPK